MKRMFFVLLSMMLIAAMIAGCGKGDTASSSDVSSEIVSSEESSKDDTVESSESEVSSEPAKPTVIDTFIFGGNDKNGKTYLMEQGERNFYYMCSPEKNKKGTYDFSKFSELELTGAEEWKPSPDDQAQYGNGYWFVLKDDGSLFPCDGFSGVVQFKAPADGRYNVTIKYYGQMKWDAPDNPIDIVPDGVYMTAFINNEKVIEHDATTKKMDPVTFKKTEVEFKKGDTVTVVADPKLNSGWDLSNWNITIEQLG